MREIHRKGKSLFVRKTTPRSSGTEKRVFLYSVKCMNIFYHTKLKITSENGKILHFLPFSVKSKYDIYGIRFEISNTPSVPYYTI
jgi:hypothetical protein